MQARNRLALTEIVYIMRPVVLRVSIASTIEGALALLLLSGLVTHYARWISQSEQVAEQAARFWRSIDWCYVSKLHSQRCSLPH
ncbi:uncharacterized protein L969DRAFT_89814 [Mixia osmundae IAM 14324]|uniref:uncharacterized protein n=1 Tax=Mixia osmundae (strain CBS 9802 / IAM 14324 / JCM 22182 / KY 12970) TaxID=764103 RepID=UPI0004A558F6|nr:uncharacterized protein L969DRAFT_89814 [Mixia osmundae IAM 14324]KEI37265.1 hypothetical protein L969DRAFT_89814 [Mixia osmundae IAM 14324]